MNSDISGKYRHYKGDFYWVHDVAHHTETGEKMVLYKGLYRSADLEGEYGPYPYFVRPYEMFFEKVIVDGVETPRFEYLGNDPS